MTTTAMAGRARNLGSADHLFESDAVELVRIRERQRFAMELHDSVAQTLFAIGVEARLALEAGDALARERSLQSIRQLAGEARTELYATLTHLNRLPASQSLPMLLEDELRTFAQTAGVDVRFACSGDPQPIGALRRELLIDVLGEALRNVRKHAMRRAERLRSVAASLRYRDGAVELIVRNDGASSSSGDGTAPIRARGGLRLLHDRAEQLQGVLEARRDDDGGAVVRLLLPSTGARSVASAAQSG